MLMQTLQLSLMSVYVEWPVNKTYLNETILNNFTLLLNETKIWTDLLIEELKNRKLYEDFKFTGEEIQLKALKLYQELLRISMISPPKKEFNFGFLNYLKKIPNKFKNLFNWSKKKNNFTKSEL